MHIRLGDILDTFRLLKYLHQKTKLIKITFIILYNINVTY